MKATVLFISVAMAAGAVAGGAECRFSYASWNVGHYALGTNWCSRLGEPEARGRVGAYRAFLDSVDADIMGVCEYSERFSTNGTFLAHKTVFASYEHFVVGPGCDESWRCNACFWNRFVFRSSRVRSFSRRKDADVVWLETRLKIGSEEVVFAQVHLDWNTIARGFEGVRANQMRELIAAYRDEKHVVISGDFNVGVRRWSESRDQVETVDDPSEYAVFVRAGYVLGNDGRFLTSEHGITANGRRGGALDNIIAKGVRISDFKVWPRYDLSDHALVSATLETGAE